MAGNQSTLSTSDCQVAALFKIGRNLYLLRQGCIPRNVFKDTASLGENVVLLAVPWPHIIDSVGCWKSARPMWGLQRRELLLSGLVAIYWVNAW